MHLADQTLLFFDVILATFLPFHKNLLEYTLCIPLCSVDCANIAMRASIKAVAHSLAHLVGALLTCQHHLLYCRL